MVSPNAPAEDSAQFGTNAVLVTPTDREVVAAAYNARRHIGAGAVSTLLRAFGVQHPQQIPPDHRAEFIARCSPQPGATPAEAPAPAQPTQSPQRAVAPPATTPPLRFTIFARAGAPLTKRIERMADGTLQITAAAQLARGTYRTQEIAQLSELPAIIAGLKSNEALAWGVPTRAQSTGDVVTVAELKGGRAPAGAIARSREHMTWPDGPGVWMLDVDLKDVPDDQRPNSLDEVRTRLIAAAPALEHAPTIALPSATAQIFDATTDERLRGLTGARLYIAVARASDVPELGTRLRDRLVLAGAGTGWVSTSGMVRVRTLVDIAVWRPEWLDFVGGAVCGEGLVQRRDEPRLWNPQSAPLEREQIPSLSDAERERLHTIEAELREAKRAEAEARRAQFVAAQRAKGHNVSASWNPDGTVEHLESDHEIRLEDGTWVTVGQLLAEPERFHKQRCADPLEPDYGGDGRIAQLFLTDQRTGPTIHSFAHGGAVYLLHPSAQAEFTTTATPPASFACEEEALASLVGDAGRVLLVAMADARAARDLWALNERLEAAVTMSHPLRALFDATVLSFAKGLHAYTAQPEIFRRLLIAQLDKESTWTRLEGQERALLVRAAYVLFAPLEQLAGLSTRAPQLVPRRAEPRTYAVEPLVPDASLVALVGPPGSGKSTLASAIGALIASPPAPDALTGQPHPATFGPWTARHGTVLSFLSEDTRGRSAWRERWASEYGDAPHLHLFDGVPPLSSVSDALEYIRAAHTQVQRADAPPLKLIIIDLFRDSFQGDENSSADVGAALVTSRAITRMFGCAVMLVHHSALADEKRARGSSAFLGALDVCCAVAMRDCTITLTVTKNRSGPTGATFRWHLDNEGVLRAGAGAPATGDVTEECARAVAHVVWEIADADAPRSRTEILAVLSEERPELFGSEVKPGTVQSRCTRAIAAARDNHWIVERRGKYVPGAERPALLPVGDLEEALQ